MQDNYDPHKDLEILRKYFSFGSKQGSAVDRIQNWIDEAAWNTDQKFTDDPLKPRVEDFMPLGAQGKAVNKLTLVDEMPPSSTTVDAALEKQRTYTEYVELARKVDKYEKEMPGLHQLCNVKDDKLAAYEVRIENVKKMLAVQADTGNKDASPHMYGMYVALELAVATLEDRNTNWEDYKGVSEHTAIERQMNDVRNKNTQLEMDNQTLRSSNKALLRQATQHRVFADGVQQGRQDAINEAYSRGVREGRAEAREEYLHATPPKAFTSD